MRDKNCKKDLTTVLILFIKYFKSKLNMSL